MFRKLFLLGVALAISSAVWAAGGHRVIHVDNFNDGDDLGWSHMDLTPQGTAVYDASGGAYLLESTELIPADDLNVGTIIATWEPSRGRRLFANGTVRGKVRANAHGTTAGYLLRANDETHTDYGFYGSTTFGTFYIERFDATTNPDAPQTIIAMADPLEAPFIAGEDYWFEASVVGNRLRFKVWNVGDEEPDEPLLSLKDKKLGPKSGTLICALAFFDPAAVEDPLVEVSATFDNITFTPGGSERGRDRGGRDDDED
jgi:hypothetical protein